MERSLFADTNARLEAERAKRLKWDERHKDMSIDALQKELADATARAYEPGQPQRHASIILAIEAKRVEKENRKAMLAPAEPAATQAPTTEQPAPARRTRKQ